MVYRINCYQNVSATALVLVSVLQLAACSAEPQRRDRFFVLEPPIASTTDNRPLAATLIVEDLAATGFVGGRQIVYRTQLEPLELRRYNVYLWEQPPARALTRNLVEALRSVGLFSRVAPIAEWVRADYRLGGELARFEHRPADSTSTVLAELTLTLISTQDRAILLSRTYQEEEVVSGRRPEDMVAAFNRLNGRIIDLFIQDLKAARPRLAPNDAR